MTDLEALVELLVILFENEVELSPNPEKHRRALTAILEDPRMGCIFVAREAGRVVATASLLYTISTAEGGKAALFEDFVVHPQFRGQGIGSSLLAFVVAQARKAGVLRITLLTDASNERAQALYRKHGFAFSSMKAMRLKLA